MSPLLLSALVGEVRGDVALEEIPAESTQMLIGLPKLGGGRWDAQVCKSGWV